MGETTPGFWDVETCCWVGAEPTHVVPVGLSGPADPVDAAAPGEHAAPLAGAGEPDLPAV